MPTEPTDDIRTALQKISEDVRSLTAAIKGDDLGNDGLVKVFKRHVQQDDARYESQVNWNNNTDKKIARYLGGAAGLYIAFQVVSAVLPILHK